LYRLSRTTSAFLISTWLVPLGASPATISSHAKA
jgi:hypothetical protein